MVLSESNQARRKRMLQQQDCRFVDREEFCSLLLGFRHLVRADDAALGVRGLRDLHTGMLYLIEREKLTPNSPQQTQPS